MCERFQGCRTDRELDTACLCFQGVSLLAAARPAPALGLTPPLHPCLPSTPPLLQGMGGPCRPGAQPGWGRVRMPLHTPLGSQCHSSSGRPRMSPYQLPGRGEGVGGQPAPELTPQGRTPTPPHPEPVARQPGSHLLSQMGHTHRVPGGQGVLTLPFTQPPICLQPRPGRGRGVPADPEGGPMLPRPIRTGPAFLLNAPRVKHT